MMNLTIYGVRDRKKIIAVQEGDTLARVRSLINERWTLEDLRRLLTLDGTEDLYARARDKPISGFDFYTGSGEKLSFQDEQTRTAASFRNHGNRNHRLFLMAREAPSLSCELLRVFVLAVVGWTPPTWFNIQTLQTKTRSLFNTDDSLSKEERRTKRKEWLKALCIAMVFCLIFLVDFSDAVVDLAIFSRGLVEGTDARGTDYGILLGVMTILARILLGWYGVAHAEIRSSAASHYYDDQELEHLAIATYFFVQLTVFVMEDGAAILYLANANPDEGDRLTRASTILTTICGIVFVGYSGWNIPTFYESLSISVRSFSLYPGHRQRDIAISENTKCKALFVGLVSLSAIGLAMSMVVLLIQQVLMKHGDDDGNGYGDEIPFSENDALKQQWTIVYGVAVSLCLLLSSRLILSFRTFEEWVILQATQLEEYREAFNDPHATRIPKGVKFSYITQPAPTHEELVRELYPFGN